VPKCLGQFNTGAEASGHFGTGVEVSWCRSVLVPKCWYPMWPAHCCCVGKSKGTSLTCAENILSVNGRHIYWTSFGKEENKGSVLLWYSCFDRSILICLMHKGLQCRISTLKHCLTKLWNDINQLTFVFPFAETRSIKQMWRQLTERMVNNIMQMTITVSLKYEILTTMIILCCSMYMHFKIVKFKSIHINRLGLAMSNYQFVELVTHYNTHFWNINW